MRAVDIGHARRSGKPRDAAAQDRDTLVVRDQKLDHTDEPGRFEPGIPIEGKTYEVVGIVADATNAYTRPNCRARQSSTAGQAVTSV